MLVRGSGCGGGFEIGRCSVISNTEEASTSGGRIVKRVNLLEFVESVLVEIIAPPLKIAKGMLLVHAAIR